MEIQSNKHAARRAVYYLIADHGTLSKTDLLSMLNIKTSSMNRLLEDLLNDGLIVESGRGPSNGGRKPILYQINETYRYVIGLEISRFYSTLGLFDMRMNPKSLTRWRMDEDMTPERFVDRVSADIRTLLQDHRISVEQVIGIGIGAVGPLDRDKGVILQPRYFSAQGWTNVPICQMISDRTGIPSVLDNGANTALLGEQWSMRSMRLQHMLYVHAGVSLRSSMMSYGQIVHGSIDMEGSIGQMIIQADGQRLYEDGNAGALEAFVSAHAIERQAQAEAKRGREGIITQYRVEPDRIQYDMLLRELSYNNAYVTDLFLHSAHYLGIGLANLINTLHPEIIILGGALINSHQHYYETAIEVARKHVYYYPQYAPVFSKGELREDAVATGAALMVWRRMEL